MRLLKFINENYPFILSFMLGIIGIRLFIEGLIMHGAIYTIFIILSIWREYKNGKSEILVCGTCFSYVDYIGEV